MSVLPCRVDHYKQRTFDASGLWQGAEREEFLREENEWVAEADKDIDRVRAKEQARGRVHAGVIEEIGASHYKNDTGNKESPHIVLRRNDGTTETVWGCLAA